MGYGCDQADLRRDPCGWPCPSLAEPQTLRHQPGWPATGCGPTGAIAWSVGGGEAAAPETGTPPIRRPPAAALWGVAHHGREGEAGAQEDTVRTYGRPGCVPPGDAPTYLRETGVRTSWRRPAYLRETNFTINLYCTITYAF
jgi:hypothetical protein